MEAAELERRLAAIVVADVEGYSRLMHRAKRRRSHCFRPARPTIDNLIRGQSLMTDPPIR